MEFINENDISNNDNDDNQLKVIFRILEMGIVFEYLCTIGVVRLLTSSRTLLYFRGIPPDILDRVLLESFHVNPSLKKCKLIKLPSTTNASPTTTSSSLITIAPSLSEVKDREILIVKMPDMPTLDDLKSGNDIMKNKIKCCFDINTVRITTTNLNDVYHVVEISNTSEPHREIVVQHHAVQTRDEMVTIYPSACDSCNLIFCEICFDCRSCADCSQTFCNECETVEKCKLCNKQKCDECGDFNVCKKCNSLVCEDCSMDDFGTGYCEKCNYFFCSECDFVAYCEQCNTSLCSKCEPVQFCADCHTSKCLSCEFMMICHKCAATRCNDCFVVKMWMCTECGGSFCHDCNSNFCFCSECYSTKCMKCSQKSMKLDLKTYEFKCLSC